MSSTSPPPPTSTTTADTDDEDDPFEEVTEDGVTYLVSPVVAQTQGVYQYPTGNGVTREYVDGEDLTAEAGDDWDGRPLTLRHPVVNRDGKPVYGLTTGPQASYTTVGEFRDSDRSTDEKLRGRVWIKQAEVGAHNGLLEDYIEDVRNGEFGDVSPGYSSATVNEHGSYNGEVYSGRQTSVAPDHVALLPDEPGNCSIADGCGVGRANSSADGPDREPRLNAAPVEVSDDSMTHPSEHDDEPRVNIRTDARTPDFDGIVTADESEDYHVWWGLADYLDAYLEETGEEFSGDPHSALSSIPDGARAWIAERTLLGSEDAESEENLLMFEVVSPDGELYEEKLEDVLGNKGSRATIPEEQRESARAVARNLLEEEFYRDLGGEEDRTNVEPEHDTSTLRKARDVIDSLLGRTNSDPKGDVPGNEDSLEDSETSENSDGTTGADTPTDDADTESNPTTMEDNDRTQILVDEHGFDEENLPNEGEDCFDRIYDKFAGDDAGGAGTETETIDGGEETESADADDGGAETTEPTETTETPETPDGVEMNEDGEPVVNLDSLDNVVDQRVEARLEEEQSSAEREQTERAIVNSAAPFEEGDLEEMNDSAVEQIAEKFDVRGTSDTSSQRASFAGRPQPTVNTDQTNEGGSAPAAGYGNARGNGGEE